LSLKSKSGNKPRITWRGQRPQPNPKHEIRNPKQIPITKTQNSKRAATPCQQSVYDSRPSKSTIKSKKLNYCITKITKSYDADYADGRCFFSHPHCFALRNKSWGLRGFFWPPPCLLLAGAGRAQRFFRHGFTQIHTVFHCRERKGHREAVSFVFLVRVLLKASFDRMPHLRPPVLSPVL
jgi:hypothetical protein